MNTNIRTKVVNDTNELIFKNKDLLVDNSPDSDTTIAEDNVTVTIVQPKDTKYSIIVYIMEYRRSDEGDIFEADTDEGHKETFKAAKGSVYLVVLLDNTTNSTSTDYYRLNTSSRGKLTSDITIKFKDDSPATIKPYYIAKGSAPWYNNEWSDKSHVVNTDESKLGQATVTCDGKITNMSGMFYYCDKLTSLDFSNFDTSIVTSMGLAFIFCKKITSLDISNFDTSKVTDMNSMFCYCLSIISLDLSNFDTSKVTNMHDMFEHCDNLTTLDLSNFNTSNVTNMEMMFSDCENLASLNISNFDTSNVVDMIGMFQCCKNLTTLDLSSFDTSKVTDMSYMFNDCYKLTTIKGIFDMKSCTNWTYMFNCPKLKNVKIKNPPADTNWWEKAGLSESRFTIVS